MLPSPRCEAIRQAQASMASPGSGAARPKPWSSRSDTRAHRRPSQVARVMGRGGVQGRVGRIVGGKRDEQREAAKPQGQAAQLARAPAHDGAERGRGEMALRQGGGSGGSWHSGTSRFATRSSALEDGRKLQRPSAWRKNRARRGRRARAGACRAWRASPICCDDGNDHGRHLHRGRGPGRRHPGLPAGGRGHRHRHHRPRAAAADGASGIRRPRLCDRGRIAPAAGGGGPMGQAARSRLPDPRHSRLGRPPRAARLADVPALRPSRGRRRCGAVRLDGRGPRAARGAERAHARSAADQGVRPGGRAGRAGRGGRARARLGRPDDRVQAGGRGGRPAVAPARGRPHPGQPHPVPADWARVRDQPRAPAPQHGARAFPARPARSRNCR